MSDVYGQAIGEITTLERRVRALQEELATYKGDAEKWTPRVGTDVKLNEQTVDVTLAFGGKNVTARVSYQAFQSGDVGTLTGAVIQAFLPTIQDQLRPVILPEIEKIAKNVGAVSTAGRW